MARLTVMINPKCIQLMPNALSIGKKTGPRIMVAEMMSMNIPTTRSSTFKANRNTNGESMAANTVSVILPGKAR